MPNVTRSKFKWLLMCILDRNDLMFESEVRENVFIVILGRPRIYHRKG